ncbi:TraB/GumN family protein [Inhella gelatinilytica]|uniref:TraB/GumN family protein n=1 Tax=Inhella gelatinilytica TaxID=2795030 RepID=A0A931IVA5_9BURK|nr:TraB/GumN family protein [Inhella gelatinilytica]MBH9551655.1 TraB/GumN family protein [Inhella gelatinilytica]
MKRMQWILPVVLLGWTLSGRAADNCPPVAAPPTAEQVQQGQAQAKDRGALWRLRKDGRTAYLYGTAHVGQLAWVFPGPKLVQALRESDGVAVEVDVTDPTAQAEVRRANAEATPLKLSSEEQARLDRQADAACVPRGAFAAFHPVMQAFQYVALSGRWVGLDPAYGQELMLIGAARALGRPVMSLESIALQLGLLLPKDADKSRRLLHMSLESLEKGEANKTLARLGQAWERGDLATLENMEALCQCQPTAEEKAFHTELNDGRNPHLAQRMAEAHGQGKSWLFAVGFLHMTGPKALPKLLEQQGFSVERVY